jgi:aminopeptidase N
MKCNLLYLLVIVSLVSQCKVNKNNRSTNETQSRILEEITVTGTKKNAPVYPYQESQTRSMDLLHTRLYLRFDYSKQHVLGKAALSFKPYFYDQKTLELDAHMFLLHRVALLGKKGDTSDLKYSYDDEVIRIELNRTYSRNDTFSIWIDYTARPNDVTSAGSSAISDAKGLYFINPLKEDPSKPRQIWSQGETQSNSGWFPTIDYPNEKMTQEIYLTVDETDVTLSNGLLIYSSNNPDKTRTDYWSQKLPSAPYLTMIAIGEFTETKDFWRDSVEVNYYLEKEYKPYAELIFGSTPEMMECFSKRLGVDYPWEKFSQIVVRDFVSGAMENTSAVVHFQLVQHDTREHLDNTWEDIIAHELFHHWFGDLVTCESWSNIPLNESFATYGEYLWYEYKYGKMRADYDFDTNLKAYLNQKAAAKKNLIRFHYRTREDMFDVVSYQKGSRVLHMLRNYVGDDAFFASLKLYLDRNRFKTVEIHDLRLAFEEVTGEDLNWFFNQWFLNNGHPVLDITYSYAENGNGVTVAVKQLQDTLQYGVYKLPVNIDIYTNGKADRHLVWVDNSNWSQSFKTDAKVELAHFDADNMLLAEIDENKSITNYYYQFEHAPLYMDKNKAVDAIIESHIDSLTPRLVTMINGALRHEFFGLRELGVELVAALPDSAQLQFEQQLTTIALHDNKATVRCDAMVLLRGMNPEKHKQLFIAATNDSSYTVIGCALYAIADFDSKLALQLADKYLDNNSGKLQMTISALIAEEATTDYTEYFESQLNKKNIYTYAILSNYALYLQRQDSSTVLKTLPGLRRSFLAGDQNMKSYFTENILKVIKVPYEDKLREAEEGLKTKKLSEADKNKWLAQKHAAQSMISKIDAVDRN